MDHCHHVYRAHLTDTDLQVAFAAHMAHKLKKSRVLWNSRQWTRTASTPT